MPDLNDPLLGQHIAPPASLLTLLGDAPSPTQDYTGRLISQKHDEYYSLARTYRALTYALRLTAGISAGILPFALGIPPVATILSMSVVICTAVDAVLDPRKKWAQYSRATDRLMVAIAKRTGSYELHKTELEAIWVAESEDSAQIPELREVLTAMRSGESA